VYVLYKSYTSISRALGMKMVEVALCFFKDAKRLGKENTIKLILGTYIIIVCYNLQ